MNTNTFDLLVFYVSSGAFGGTDGPVPGSSTVGEANNGIDISNVRITFSTDQIILGDVNRDGVASFLDIIPFLNSIGTGVPYVAEADCNQDGIVNFGDIAPLIQILSGN